MSSALSITGICISARYAMYLIDLAGSQGERAEAHAHGELKGKIHANASTS